MDYRGEELNVDEMDIEGLKKVIKILIELMNFEHDRLTALQSRVIDLEWKLMG
jgi:hypothetical protein